ncbi:hypothetical protein HDU67_006494 [Dinochytrium kinnereticum]|nr:hypothetical protein HDU67_006494 [Dinochytrium kinnereticum]
MQQYYSSGAGDLSPSLFEPLGAQQIIFPDLQTITNLANSAASRKRKGDMLPAPKTVAKPASQEDFKAFKDQEYDDDHSGDEEGGPPQKRKPGRKLAQTTPANKRTAQNRAAQRAFRERKERYLKDLEAKAEELEALRKAMASGGMIPAPAAGSAATHSPEKDILMAENRSLKNRISELESENSVLREMTFTFDFNSRGSNSSTTGANSSIFGGNFGGLLATPAMTTASPASSIAGGSTASVDGNTLNHFLSTGPVASPDPAGQKSLNASPDDLFAIFDSPFVGLPDDLSFPLPDYPGGGGLSASYGAFIPRPTVQAQQPNRSVTPLSATSASPAVSLMRSNDLDIPVFDMDAFLKGSSPDDLDVFGDPISAASTAAVSAAANSALLSQTMNAINTNNNLGFTALLQQQLSPPMPTISCNTFANLTPTDRTTPPSDALRQQLMSLKKEIPEQLPAVCCENQEPDVIDELCEIFKTKAQCSEMQNLQNKILEACNNGDKDRVLDLVDVCKEKKRMYLLRLKAGVSVLPKNC